MSVRAKFKCQSIKFDENGSEIVLQPVTSNSPENADFFKWTPSGEIRMSVVNPDAATQFKPGAQYFVYFTEAQP